MKNICMALMTLFFIFGLQIAALAAPDTYIGDAAIYSAVDAGTTRPKPNVLIVVDNSRTTLNSSAGEKYVPATTYPLAGYNPWDIYVGNNLGTFTKIEVANATSALSNLTCATAVVRDTLLVAGTYSGSGSTLYPNLNGGACATGPKGATYALGNYLNYTNKSTTTPTDVYVRHNLSVPVKIKGTWTTELQPRSFKLLSTHTAVTGVSGNEPNVATNWTTFWEVQSSTVTLGTPWSAGTTYTLPATAAVGDTQRKIISDALDLVVTGARYSVNFGLMTYGGNNSGGKLLSDIKDLSNDAALNAFKTAIPGPGEADGEPVLSSQTGRPQAESVFDAGYYYGAPYSSVTNTNRIPTAMVNPCGYNHIILITNGLSNGDGSPQLSVIGDADQDGYPDEAVYGAGSHYLDDIAYYLNNTMGIRTHTVLAFQAADALVQKAAFEGDGQFYNVYSANELSDALTKLLTTIVLEADTSFVAPVVPASSTNRTISSNRVYLGLFKPQNNQPWIGNLKKYGVSKDLTLLAKNNAPATDQLGDFLPASKSFWGADGSGNIMSIDGLLPLASGDGGNVDAGGVGGSLLLNLQAGLAASSQAWQTRNIYTWVTGSLPLTLGVANRFSPTNINITATTLAVADAANKDKLINFVAGADGYDDNKDGDSTEIRDWVLGDILHSKPLIFSYGAYTEAEETDCTKNKSMIFVGSNDGMFHAFRDCDGKEEWAFIPDNVLPNLKYLRESDHHYFADAAPTAYVHDVNNNNIIETAQGDKVVLIFGQGRGGGRSTLDASEPRGAYYALDVSNPAAPVLLWKVDSTTTGFGELGETWSPPRLAKVKVGSETKVVAFVGAGYDNNEDLRFGSNMLFPIETDLTTNTTLPIPSNGTSTGSDNPFNPRGRGVFALGIATLKQDYGTCTGGKYCPDFTGGGSLVWSFVKANDNGKGMDYSIPSDLTVLDMNGDGFQDRIYVGDTGGRLWRFDVGSTNVSDWTSSGRMIFKSNKDGESYTGRKIFYRPTVALLQGIPTLYFGTGDRNHPLNTAMRDRIFAVKDREQTSPMSIDNLVNLTDNELQHEDTTADEIKTITDNLAASTNYGWYVDLNQNVGEKVLASALVFNKQAFYTTYTPTPTADLGVCQVGNLGGSRLYQLDYATAEATQNYYAGNDNTTTYANNLRAKGGDGIVLQREDRIRDIGEGIPSGIVTLIDASGKVTLMISSSNRVGTYQAPDAKMISPLYWIKY